MILLFILIINLIKTLQKRQENTIYYSSPDFSLRNTNVTLAANLWVGRFRNESLAAIAEGLTSICQAVLINQKRTNFSIDGIINMAFQEYNDFVGSGQDAIVSLLANNLYSPNRSSVNWRDNVNITGFITNSNFGTAKINSLPFNDFFIPSISAGDLSRGNPDNQFSGLFPAMNRSFFQIMNTFDYNSFDAVLDVLKFFNWTLVGNMYQSNTFGYNRQQSVLDYAAQYSTPSFACNVIFGKEGNLLFTNTSSIVDSFCKCVTDKNTINVIVLWMSTSSASFTIKALRNKCSAAKKWTFIIADDFQSPNNIVDDFETFKYSLLVRNNGPWSYKNFLRDCRDNLPESAESAVKQLFTNYFKFAYGCETEPPANETLTQCVQDFYNRTQRCLCTLDETEQDPYTSKLLFTADIVSVYAAAISLLQNNCTFLNNNREGYLDTPVDFCSLTTFTPADLSFAIRFVNITGYSGPIWFPKNVLIRSIKSFFLYSAYNTTLEAVLVGKMDISGVEIDARKVEFIDGKVPISEIVPQNINLSYPIVAVFFGISIVAIIISIALIIFIYLHRDYRSIRQNAPWITLIMLFAVLGMSISLLLFSFSRTDALCYTVLFIARMSSMLLIIGLFAKNYRIYLIFSNTTATALNITESRLILWIAIYMIIYMAALVSLAVSLDYGAMLKYSSKDQYYQYIQCTVPNKTWAIFIELFLLITLLIPVVGSLILAWLTRKVKAEYRESSALVAFSVIIIITIVVFAPLSMTLTDESDSEILRYSVFVEYYTLVIVSAFGLLFFPRVYDVLKVKRKQQRFQDRISRVNQENHVN